METSVTRNAGHFQSLFGRERQLGFNFAGKRARLLRIFWHKSGTNGAKHPIREHFGTKKTSKMVLFPRK
jgi:hypothetical protein